LYLSRGGIHQLQQRQQPLAPIPWWNLSTSATLAATFTYPEVEFINFTTFKATSAAIST
jgi:hypothetical protein